VVQAERKVNRKARSGTVVSAKNDQTVIVAVSRATRHRLYGKVVRQTKRYPVHDPENQATLGDLVVIEECRPISKTKRWRLVEVLTEREVAEVRPESIDEALVDEVQRSAARAAADETDDAGEVVEAEPPAAEQAPPAVADETPAAVAEAASEPEAAAEEAVSADASAETEQPGVQPDDEQPDDEQAGS